MNLKPQSYATWYWSQIVLLNDLICEAAATQDCEKKKLKNGRRIAPNPTVRLRDVESHKCLHQPHMSRMPIHSHCLRVAGPGRALGHVAGSSGGHQPSWPRGSCEPGDFRDFTQAHTVLTAVTKQNRNQG